MLLSRFLKSISSSTEKYANRLNPDIAKSKDYSGKDAFDSVINNSYLDEVSAHDASLTKNDRVSPQWGKKVLLIIGVLLGCFVLFELGSILYIYAIYPQKAGRQHEKDVKKAYENIAMADSTARALFSCEYASGGGHLSSYYDYIIDDCGICHFNHIEEGLKLLRYAAEQGDPQAQCSMGQYYAGYDFRAGVKEDEHYNKNKLMTGESLDYPRAAYWFLNAAEKGNPLAMYNLAISYRNGWGVSQNLRKYYDWMVKSAEAGYHNGLLKLGDFYRDGVVVEEERLFESDLEKAKYYWGESAKRGNEEAKKRLETIY